MLKKIVIFLCLTFGSIGALTAEIIENVQIRVGDQNLTYTLFDTLDEFDPWLRARGLSLFYFINNAYYGKYHNSSTEGVWYENTGLSPNVISTMRRYNKKISYTYYVKDDIDYYVLNIHDDGYGGRYYHTYIINGL